MEKSCSMESFFISHNSTEQSRAGLVNYHGLQLNTEYFICSRVK